MIEWILPSTGLAFAGVVAGTVGMYLTIMVFARWSGVRSFAELSTFDVAVTIANGSLLASTIATQNPPLLQGMLAVAMLFIIQLTVSRLRRRFPRVRHLLDNEPILLMGPGGELKPKNMRVARVTEADLRTHLRQANCADPATVQAVVMDGTGGINVLHGHGGSLSEDAWILRGVRDHEANHPASERLKWREES